MPFRYPYNRSSDLFHPSEEETPPIPESTLSTSTLTIPWPRLDLLLSPPLVDAEGSLPMVGRTLSLAERLTNSANGTNQTHKPKYDATSVNEGMSLRAS